MTTGASSTTNTAVVTEESEGPSVPSPVDPSTLESANWWFDFSSRWLLLVGAVAATAACMTVALAFKQWQSDRVRERHADWRIASLEKEAELARRETARANESAAKANERAAGLEAEAERLKKVVAWRTLTPEAATTLKEQLSKQPGAVEIQFILTDPESTYFTKQLADAFGAANWRVAVKGLNLPGRVIWGTHVQGEGTEERRLIEAAFNAAGVWFSGEDIEPAAPISDELVPANAPRLIIGSKKPPKTLTTNAK